MGEEAAGGLYLEITGCLAFVQSLWQRWERLRKRGSEGHSASFFEMAGAAEYKRLQ